MRALFGFCGLCWQPVIKGSGIISMSIDMLCFAVPVLATSVFTVHNVLFKKHDSLYIFIRWRYFGGDRFDVLESVMEVLRPDFMGLGLISVSSLKGLGLARDYSIETTRPEGGENEKRRMKKVGRFQYPQWIKWCFSCRKMFPVKKNDVFCVEKYLTRTILGLGLGLGF